MPSWFKKVFSGQREKLGAAARPVEKPPSLDNPALGEPDTSGPEEPKARKVVHAPQIMPEEERSGWTDGVRIKARVEKDMMSCILMVDRPVLAQYSALFPGAQWAEGVSPLAEAVFRVKGVGSVLLHDMTVTLTLGNGNTRPWEELALEAGGVIRSHLKEGKPVVSEEFLKSIPLEDVIRERIQSTIDLEINPGIASHSGVITLERVKGNTVYITMGGGCQGCAASTITLRQGIHTAFRKAVPQLGAIYDETDHSAGTNPFYDEIPAEMM